MSSKPTTILFVDHTPFAGGAQLVLADHIAELDKAQFRPLVACTDTVPWLIERYQRAGAKVIVLDMPKLRGGRVRTLIDMARTIKNLRKLIRTHSVDIVVSNTTRASYLASIAVIATNAKLIWWVRDFLYPKLLFSILKFLPSRIICVSQAIKQHYMSSNDSKGEVIYVANSLYRSLPAITPEQIQNEKKRWGIEPESVVIGFMGRLVAEKGAEDVVKAVAGVAKTHSQIKLLVIGSGKDQMHDVEEDLHRYVRNAALSDVVAFTGYQDNEALYYSMLDIFILATRDREPFATSVVQAMMAGCAVIGTNAGGTPELVTHEQTGLLYKPGNVDDLAVQIKRLLDDRPLRKKLSVSGQNYVLQYHREELITDQLEQVYRQILSH